MKRNKLTKCLMAVFALVALISCNKEKNTITEYIGTVIEGTTMAPLPDVKVSVANGSRVLVSTVTDEEGAFSVYVNFDKVNERDSLIIDGSPDLPYQKKFELKGIRKEQYDYGTLVLYNRSNTEVRTSEVTSIKANSAVCGGIVNEGNDILVTQRGVCWSKQPNPILFNNNNITLDGEGGGQFTSNLTGLEEQTKYYVRAYATNGDTVVYGSQKEFTTTALLPAFQYAGTTYYVHPDVGTMTWQSAIDYCENLTFAGYSDWFLPDKDELNTMYVNRNTIGGFVTSYSHNEDECKYWSSTKTGSYPWYQRFNDGYQHDAAASNYFRVRPVRKDGGGGGGTTPTAPTVTTNTSPTVTSNSAICGGNVVSTGGADIIERGVYYSTSPNPVTSGQLKPSNTSGTGTGIFTCDLTNLSANTKYYYCAYARNSVEPSYGAVESFMTLNNPSAPTVTTGSYSNVFCNSAICGGSVTAENGVNIDQRGICFGISPNPTTSNQIANGGTGTGSFTCKLSGLSANTKYYYRAFAVYNGNDEPVYGEQKDFTTLSYTSFEYSGSTYYVHPEVGTMTWQSAIDYCNNLSYAGYSDWFLPDKDELNAMYVYRNTIGEFVTTDIYGTESYYWSSTPEEDDEAWFQKFYNGHQSHMPKTKYYRVRPVRKIGGGGNGSAPSAPTGVSAEVIGSRIKVFWNSVSNADSYTVYWSNDGNSYNFEIGTTSNTYIFDDAPTEYNYYKVKAKNSYGESPLSSSYGYCHYSSGGHVEGRLQYDDGNGIGAAGFTDGGTFYWADMFPASMLSQYYGTSITKVDANFNRAGVYTLQIYTGGTTSPETLIFERNYTHNYSTNVWATMALPNPVSLNTSKNLWIVISTTHSANEYPAGFCQNSGEPNGRWYSDGIDWEEHEEYTWGIHTFVSNGVKGEMQIGNKQQSKSETDLKKREWANVSKHSINRR